MNTSGRDFSFQNDLVILYLGTYNARYKNLTSGGILLDEYEAGDIFKIGDKEYILSENHTLDIPYGEDIYNLEYPSNYKFGKKVE